MADNTGWYRILDIRDNVVYLNWEQDFSDTYRIKLELAPADVDLLNDLQRLRQDGVRLRILTPLTDIYAAGTELDEVRAAVRRAPESRD